MDVMTAIKARRSVRGYKDKPVEDEKLNAVLEAGRLAPSASNRQEWKFIVVKNEDTRKKLARAANNQSFVGEAPVVIVACAISDIDHVMACGQLSYPIDLAIAVDHITLKAAEEDLGTCWIGAFQEDQVKEILGIPEYVRVVTVLPLGYPDQPLDPSRRKRRKSREEAISFEKWE